MHLWRTARQGGPFFQARNLKDNLDFFLTTLCQISHPVIVNPPPKYFFKHFSPFYLVQALYCLLSEFLAPTLRPDGFPFLLAVVPQSPTLHTVYKLILLTIKPWSYSSLLSRVLSQHNPLKIKYIKEVQKGRELGKWEKEEISERERIWTESYPNFKKVNVFEQESYGVSISLYFLATQGKMDSKDQKIYLGNCSQKALNRLR